MNEVTYVKVFDVHECSCGARACGKDVGRFLKRHPKLCSARAEFNKKLASGTRSVDQEDFENVDEFMKIVADEKIARLIEDLDAVEGSLSDWEREFVLSLKLSGRLKPGATQGLSVKQVEVLLRIHKTRA